MIDISSQLKQMPIRREGLAEKVLHRILGLVQSGNLKPGDRLPSERNLMDILGVSRPPIREALSALSILGVVESRHGGGAVITDLTAHRLLRPLDFYLSLSDQNIRDMFDCRRLIEVEAAGKAACSRDDDGKEKLVKLATAQQGLTEAVSFRIADKEFHEKISQLAGNDMLTRLNDGLYNLGLDIRREASKDPATVEKSITEHEQIATAIQAGHQGLAREAMAKHLSSIEQSTLDVLSKHQSESGKRG